MSHTPQHASAVCTHERRPGTTVCLRCRHAARVAARAKTNRSILRAMTASLVVATVIGAGVFGARAIRGRQGNAVTSVITQHGTAAVPSSAAAPSMTQVAKNSAGQAAATIQTAADQNRRTAPLSPVVPVGESGLTNGITAMRGDTDVVVSFDLPMSRTRVPERFERLLRSTLPHVYGAAAVTLLTALPSGAIAQQGDLLTELPMRGVRIPVDTGWDLRVYPETRPGHDGPLVIRYRALLTPASE